MPSVLRRSGPPFERGGQMIEPRALVSFCEGCNSPHAPFGLLTKEGKLLTYCGQVNGTMQCVNKQGNQQ